MVKLNLPTSIKRVQAEFRAPKTAYVGTAAVFTSHGVEFIVLCADAVDIQGVLELIDPLWVLDTTKVYSAALVKRSEIDPLAALQ